MFDRYILVIVISLFIILGGLLVLDQATESEYLYLARGIECKEFDKDSNTLKQCKDGNLGEVELINPISVIKVRIR